MHKITFQQLRQGNLGELFAVLEAELVAQGIDFYLIGAILPATSGLRLCTTLNRAVSPATLT